MIIQGPKIARLKSTGHIGVRWGLPSSFVGSPVGRLRSGCGDSAS
jgi:hypothetical protein